MILKKVNEFKDLEDFKAFISKQETCFIVFSKNNCPGCVKMELAMDKLFEAGHYDFPAYKVCVEEKNDNPKGKSSGRTMAIMGFMAKLGVRCFPHTIGKRDGKIVCCFPGAPGSNDPIIKLIDSIAR